MIKNNLSKYHELGVSDETFYKIIFHGFYYIDFDTLEIHFADDAVFLGNEYGAAMIRTFSISDGVNYIDAHGFDWHRDYSYFSFDNYNKKWSADRKVLEAVINDIIYKDNSSGESL